MYIMYLQGCIQYFIGEGGGMNTPLPQKELGYEGKIVRFVEFQKKHFNFRYS